MTDPDALRAAIDRKVRDRLHGWVALYYPEIVRARAEKGATWLDMAGVAAELGVKPTPSADALRMAFKRYEKQRLNEKPATTAGSFNDTQRPIERSERTEGSRRNFGNFNFDPEARRSKT